MYTDYMDSGPHPHR